MGDLGRDKKIRRLVACGNKGMGGESQRFLFCSIFSKLAYMFLQWR